MNERKYTNEWSIIRALFELRQTGRRTRGRCPLHGALATECRGRRRWGVRLESVSDQLILQIRC